MKILIVTSFNKGFFAPFILEQSEALEKLKTMTAKKEVKEKNKENKQQQNQENIDPRWDKLKQLLTDK